MKLQSTVTNLVFWERMNTVAAFYRDLLGYEVDMEHKELRLGNLVVVYMMMKHDSQGIGFQARRFLEEDVWPDVAKHILVPGSYLYHSVEEVDLDEVQGQPGAKVLLGPRKSSYGAIEIWALDSSGVVHVFGKWDAPPPKTAEQ